MFEARLESLLDQASRNINYNRVLMVVATADKINSTDLLRLLDAIWPGQVTAADLTRYQSGGLLRLHRGLYYVHGAARQQLIERFQGRPEYRQTCRILRDKYASTLMRLQEEAWEAAVQAALFELGIDPIGAGRKLQDLFKIAPSEEAAKWLQDGMDTYSMPAGSRR